ncbi:MAG: hypothetical protein EA397_18405 [Deltaproteobacteria bacterium]|nr:MAG: hypothetical protein EA397_18405 [Deltaproteobacteria bacterium]
MNYTGRGIQGPGADLLLAEAGAGRACVAVAYQPALAGRSELSAGLDEVRDFLRKPSIDGLLPLLSEPEPGHFVYDRRGGLTVREILLAFRRLGRPAGERAGLELMLQGAEVLADAQERARQVGLSGHGDLSPWRLLVDDEGYTDVFGYGLPCLPLIDFLEERADAVPADALRYAPPERLELQAEDVLSDLYSLALIAAEFIAGEPVFDGDAEQVIAALLSGEAPARIEQRCPDLPDAALDLLCICCELDPTARYRDAEEVIRMVKRCLREAEGPSLKDVLDEALAVDVLVPLGVVEPEAAPEPAEEVPKESPKKGPKPVAKEKSTKARTPEPEPVSDDPLGLPPPLPALPPDATLDDVRKRAQAILARIAEIASRVHQIGQRASEESSGAPSELASLVRRIGDAKSKVEKATASAKRSAGLVELDEDAGDAIITLGLVTGSEQQAESAIEAARGWLDELREGMVEVKRTQEQIAGLAKQAHSAAEAASRQLNTSEELVGELDRAIAAGELSAPGVEPASDQAHKAIARARGAASKANDAVGQVRRASSVGDAEASLGSVKAAVDVVKKAAEDVEKAVQSARKAEASGLDAARGEVAGQASTATEAAEGAQKALTRAKKAVENGHDDEARRLVKRAVPLAKQAQDAAAAAKAESGRATAAKISADARDALVPARRAARDATDAAEQVQALCKRAVALAGAAAQAAEALAAARDAADKALKRASSSVEKAAAEVESLLRDTDEVEGHDALAARELAVSSLDQAKEHLSVLKARHERFGGLTEPEDAESDLGPLKAVSVDAVTSCERAQEACQRCRDLAEDEIREILKERRRLESLEKHASAAKKHAEQCRVAVDKAWKRYKSLPEAVSRSDISAVRKQLKEAYEVIDIAEFQAGEAKTAADEAARQGDPNEAAGYAESAASFWERISEDLPEALRAIDEAEEVALAEAKAIDEARSRTAEAATEAVTSRDAIRAALTEGTELSAGWSKNKAVMGALDRIKKADKDLDASVTEAEYARDRAASCNTSADASEMIPVGEGAARSLSDKRKAAEAGLSDLKKAVQSAVAAKKEVADLRDEVSTLAAEALDAYKHVKACQERLDKVLARHGAAGPDASRWQEGLEEALNKARNGRKRAKEAADNLREGTPVKEARTLAERARKGHKIALDQRAVADEAEREGEVAAKAEAKARAEAEERRRAESREAAQADLERVSKAIRSVEEALAEVEELLGKASSREGNTLRDEAASQLDKLRRLQKKAQKASAEAAEADAADAVLSAALDAREAAQRSTSASRDALSKLAEARTLALAAAEQAAALTDLRSQVADLAKEADAAVKMAREQLGFLDEILDEAKAEHTLSLRQEAEEAIASVRKAATKVHTAVPMVAEAESLDVAVHMLKAARRAVEAANDAAAQVPQLVSEAQSRLEQEREAAKRALSEARQAVSAPLETAQAAESKAQSWVSECEPLMAEHVEEPGIPDAFAEISAAFSTLQSLFRKARELAEPGSSAGSVEAANTIAAAVQSAVDEVVASATDVRRARDAFDAKIKKLVADKARFTELRAAREDAATQARDRLGEAREAYSRFEDEVDEAELDPRETGEMLDHIEDALREAADAVHGAQEACGPVREAEDLEALEAVLKKAERRADAAIAALDDFDKTLADGRDEFGRMVEEAEERRKQEAEAARIREAEEREERARAEREAARRRRPRGGLRPAGPPRRDVSASLARSGDASDEGEGRRLRRPSRTRDAERRPSRRSAAPDRESGDESTGGRQLRPPRRGRRSGDEGTGGRLRPPSGRAARPTRGARGSRDEPESTGERRLRRPSRLDRGSASRRSADGERPSGRRSAERRSERADEAPRPDRRLRRPSSRRDDGPPSRSRRAGPDPSDRESPPDRRLRRPERSGRASDAEDGEEREDLRSRLRERRASRMASGTSSSGSAERPSRPERPGRPERPESRGRPPLRPPSLREEDEAEASGPREEMSGADLLRQRLKDRSQGRVRRPAPEDDLPRSRRSVDGLMSRIKKKSQD